MQYLLLFLSSFLAATIIPFSSEAHFYFLVSEGYNKSFLLLSASLGNTAGGMSSYALGFWLKWSWLEKYFRITQEKVSTYKPKIRKYGYLIALFCWLPIVGDVIAVALGAFKLNWRIVLIIMLLGKACRYAVLLLV